MVTGITNSTPITGMRPPKLKEVCDGSTSITEVAGKTWYRFNWSENTAYLNQTDKPIWIVVKRSSQNLTIYVSPDSSNLFDATSVVGVHYDTKHGDGKSTHTFWVPSGWYFGVKSAGNDPSYDMQWIPM